MRSSVRSKPCKLRLGSHGEGDLRDPKTVSCCRGREERTRVHGHDRRLSRPALSLPPRLELLLVPSSSSSLLPLLLHWDLGGPPLSPTCPTAPDYPTDKQTYYLKQPSRRGRRVPCHLPEGGARRRTTDTSVSSAGNPIPPLLSPPRRALPARNDLTRTCLSLQGINLHSSMMDCR